ncbi:MAG: hypothetical protein ACRDRS_25965 [Pseudonocardiaceae bacterium]
MSAFTVTTVPSDAPLTAGLAFCTEKDPLAWHYPPPTATDPGTVGRERALTRSTTGRVGAMVLAENTRSVNHNYDEDYWEPAYVFHPLRGAPDPLVALKSIACLRPGRHRRDR